MSLKEIVARQDWVARQVEKWTEYGFIVWQGRIPLWVMQDGWGGICLFPEGHSYFDLMRVTQLLTGVSNIYSAIQSYATQELYPHLSNYSRRNM